MKQKKAKPPAARALKPRSKTSPTLGRRIIEGLEQAVAWTRGHNKRVQVTLVEVPQVDVREVRTKMGLSQSQFATKFGLPPKDAAACPKSAS